MGSLFLQLGRKVGYATIPAIRKSRWLWQSLTGTEAESIRAETEFGRAMASALRLKLGVVHDGEDLALVRSIGQRLSACVRNKERSFFVDISRGEAPNAMALPGGFIFVSHSLLDFCERQPDELAFVIGHEMGHVIRGHALERVLHHIGVEGISVVLSRGLLNPMIRDAGLKWLESAHSREAELDADEFGARVAKAAGFDAGGGIVLLRRLSALRAKPRPLNGYFASHPPEDERIANLKTTVLRTKLA